jgi:hypothetical protein
VATAVLAGVLRDTRQATKGYGKLKLHIKGCI